MNGLAMYEETRRDLCRCPVRRTQAGDSNLRNKVWKAGFEQDLPTELGVFRNLAEMKNKIGRWYALGQRV